MKFKNEIFNKFDIMKSHSFNFLENEKMFSESVHENNVGKIEYDAGKEECLQSTKEVKSMSTEVNKVAEETSSSDQVVSKSEVTMITSSRIDDKGSAPKRYTTRCYITLQPVPCWFSESLSVDIASGEKKYDDTVFYKDELRPSKWSESMTTEVNTFPKKINSESSTAVVNDEHHMSLEPQQLAAAAASQ